MAAPAAAIPAWAIWTAIGSKALGGFMKGQSATKSADADRKQRNKEFLANISMQNKQLDQSSDQFSQVQKMKQSEATKNAPKSIMDSMSMIRNLGQTKGSTADSMKYLLS